MSVTVSDNEIRRTLESVRDKTLHPEVRRMMERALELYRAQPQPAQSIDPGLTSAAKALLDEMAKTKRLERTILWLGPLVALAVTAVLFGALRVLWLGL
ncbi:MAG TPA: hypothetical protein GXX23_02640 [Firmicutes bacterium]|nr:hypothetical protein [Candidatus Fermentithermobacillaceae bacterium]